MIYKDTGFRPFYHRFIAVPMKESLKEAIKGFPLAASGDYILTYGYIDQERGLTLEVLAAARKSEDGFRFAAGNDKVRSFIRIGAVAEDEVYYFEDEKGELAGRYANKLEMLREYDVSDEIEETRKMTFLDGCRDENYIDDVLVYLTKDELDPEGCWVRIIGLGDHYFIGRLLNEPDQDFGYHEGERIAFFVNKTKDDRFICYSDLNPSRKLTAEDLEDGSMLEAAIRAFNEERNQEHLIEILEILRDSYVWVPCNAVMSEEDEKRLEEMLLSLQDNPEALVGEQFVTRGETRMIPDILQSGDAFFFPVFSTAEAMGEYGESFSKVQKHMLEVLPLARNNDREPVGIVINAFTEPFVLDKEIWDLVEGMKSRVE